MLPARRHPVAPGGGGTTRHTSRVPGARNARFVALVYRGVAGFYYRAYRAL